MRTRIHLRALVCPLAIVATLAVAGGVSAQPSSGTDERIDDIVPIRPTAEAPDRSGRIARIVPVPTSEVAPERDHASARLTRALAVWAARIAPLLR